MGIRYRNSRILINSSEYYEPLRKSRGLKRVRQYATPILAQPTVAQRARVTSTKHLWKYGDRLYKLANQYYGDSTYWWVIAWYNGYPTEASIPNGSLIFIPLNLKDALEALGV